MAQCPTIALCVAAINIIVGVKVYDDILDRRHWYNGRHINWPVSSYVFNGLKSEAPSARGFLLHHGEIMTDFLNASISF